MTYRLYNSWTIEEAKNIGAVFQAVCLNPRGYEGDLTLGKEYTLTVTPRILPTTPLCSTVGDSGRVIGCHLERFEKKGDQLPD